MSHSPSDRPDDRTLLARIADGDEQAIETLTDRYAGSGVAMAQRLAGAGATADRVLDLVHDAFVTAVDEALDSNADSPRELFIRLLGDLSTPMRDGSARLSGSTVSSAELRQLRADIVSEIRLTVSLRAQSPRSWTRVRRIADELRRARRRFRAALRLGSLYDDLELFGAVGKLQV